jgi:hypothetical protein
MPVGDLIKTARYYSMKTLIAESVKRFSPSSTDAGGERIHRESRWVPLVCDLIYRGKNRLE